MKPEFKKNESGFTLIELVIVFTLIGILVGLGIPQYRNAIIKGKEAVLKENLYIMRTLIQQYYTDKKKYPPTLYTLVDEGYMIKIPLDPFTGSAESWTEVPENLTADDLLTGVIPGVADIHSGAEAKALDGTFYNTW